MRDGTLIVSASYGDLFPEWYAALPEPKVRQRTEEGGHPSMALIRAFRADRRHDSYLLVHDSMEPLDDDPVAPFREAAEKHRTPVVGWASFPLFYDTPEQQAWVERQYQYVKRPEFGIFGPTFYVERKPLEQLDKIYRLPAAPPDKLMAQGTERAWAYAFALLGVKPAFLHEWSNEFLASGDALPFRKEFAGRQ